MNRTALETALDNGNLWIAMASGRYWKARRNGATKTWKTRPDDYSIPVKAGLKSCGRITPAWTADHYKISETDPNK